MAPESKLPFDVQAAEKILHVIYLASTTLLIGCVCLFSLTYTSPVFFEFEWSTINDTIKVLKTELREKKHPTSKVYYQIYRTWMNFFVRFLIPTLFLVITNISIIKKVTDVYKPH